MENAADRKDVRKAEKLAKANEAERRVFMANTMSTMPGRRWMYDTLYACHVFTTSFAPEPTTMAFQEGERNIGLRLLGEIMSACPEQFHQMMREANERHTRSDDTADRNASDDGKRNGGGSGGYDTTDDDLIDGNNTADYYPYGRVYDRLDR